MPKQHKCPNCGIVGECIILEESKNPHHCLGCGFEWRKIPGGEIEVVT